ncbi:bifunctional DNA-formamidopyrimidine glycosylase/DNA-(apurinic or apyrimidinic site) lyase [Chitinivorax sp. B]|uniref:bifunctional DNA-formamidopyrimidine glycosylase/DNA-(apurinic or apyrimidinic site) lyase n=1 Tax=Chitinivorax sp. B TaxID=2502235 RepID=UPI0010FA55D8|nr:bifunctional DNA-formamidopyrimidine glycosylase/DNA-(apurinic or apyrimidinic site) lyase [Chitinivorax sp. B]
MPELPEVETTRRGIEPCISGQKIQNVVIRNHALRWPISEELPHNLIGSTVLNVNRRAKYLLINVGHGGILIHLGMSGSLRIVAAETPPKKHDHVDIIFINDYALRLHDPRRFGAVLWQPGDLTQHPLLTALGPEPLLTGFNAQYLHQALRKRQIAIKPAIMDNHIVVGVGNIYASESLFRAGIHPATIANKVSLSQCQKVVDAIKTTLEAALMAGGSTLRDFVNSDGGSGYFQLQTNVYDRAGQGCKICGNEIRQIRQGQRSTFFCPGCQH